MRSDKQLFLWISCGKVDTMGPAYRWDHLPRRINQCTKNWKDERFYSAWTTTGPTGNTKSIQRRSIMPEQIYSYSVKFVCGTQESTRDCTSVRPGVYSTEINIHNFKNAEAHIQKYVLPIVFAGKPPVREPEYVKPVGQHEITLPPQTATMDDCCS